MSNLTVTRISSYADSVIRKKIKLANIEREKKGMARINISKCVSAACLRITVEQLISEGA